MSELCRMVKNDAMSKDWGEMLYQYTAERTSNDTANMLRKREVIGEVLQDAEISHTEAIRDLKLKQPWWVGMGGKDQVLYTENETTCSSSYKFTLPDYCISTAVITKSTFVAAMKAYCGVE